jgi:hypothetical protein
MQCSGYCVTAGSYRPLALPIPITPTDFPIIAQLPFNRVGAHLPAIPALEVVHPPLPRSEWSR